MFRRAVKDGAQNGEETIDYTALELALRIQRQCADTARVSAGMAYTSTIARRMDVRWREALLERRFGAFSNLPPPPDPDERND